MDDTGSVVERYEYSDYGSPTYMDATWTTLTAAASDYDNPYLFTGRRYDNETAWYNYRTRYFDPFTGRFTTGDTIGNWGDTLNIGNSFSYVGNSPWAFLDPLGTDSNSQKKKSKNQGACFSFDLGVLPGYGSPGSNAALATVLSGAEIYAAIDAVSTIGGEKVPVPGGVLSAAGSLTGANVSTTPSPGEAILAVGKLADEYRKRDIVNSCGLHEIRRRLFLVRR